MYKKQAIKTVFFSIFVMFFGMSFSDYRLSGKEYMNILIPPVYADDDDDDDDEDEDDDEHEDDDEDYEEEYETKKIKVKPVYRTVYVEKVVVTLDPVFTRDTDRDGIVDGLDPHPNISEKEFFTDDDNDGVANVFDMYKGEDDFAYYEQENDTNQNGILDSYEAMALN